MLALEPKKKQKVIRASIQLLLLTKLLKYSQTKISQ